MTNNTILQIIGVIEIAIGSSALLGNFLLLALSLNAKSFNVLIFVIITGCMSTLIGIGILKLNATAYKLLLYFSTFIVLSKLLLFFHIIELNGQLEISIHEIFNIPLSEGLKNFMINFKSLTSIGYHSFLIYILRQENIKKEFVH